MIIPSEIYEFFRNENEPVAYRCRDCRHVAGFYDIAGGCPNCESSLKSIEPFLRLEALDQEPRFMQPDWEFQSSG